MEIAFTGVFGVVSAPFWSTQGFQRFVWQRDKKWKGFSKGWEAMI